MTVDPRLLAAVETLIAAHRRPGNVPLIAISGAQGLGKTTLARAAAARTGATVLSLDDAYLGGTQRQARADAVHPLFATRGPPLTHDIAGLIDRIDRLREAGPEDRTPLPVFDKRRDDLAPRADWPVVVGRPSAILIEGWLLGATPQNEADLAVPVNALERERDPDGVWRGAANRALGAGYRALFERFDALLFLQAPAFDVVLDWRCEQEAGLMGVAPEALPAARRADLAVFIQGFERISRHMLAGGVRADRVARLAPDRRVLGVD